MSKHNSEAIAQPLFQSNARPIAGLFAIEKAHAQNQRYVKYLLVESLAKNAKISTDFVTAGSSESGYSHYQLQTNYMHIGFKLTDLSVWVHSTQRFLTTLGLIRLDSWGFNGAKSRLEELDKLLKALDIEAHPHLLANAVSLSQPIADKLNEIIALEKHHVC